MKLSQRLRIAWDFLRSGKTVAAMAPSWQTEQAQYAMDSNFEVLVKEGYRKNELIFACLNATAAAASQINVELVRKSDDKPVDSHPFLDLIHRPNDQMNETDFWAAVVLFQKLAGRAFFEVEYSNRREPVALWPLRPDWMRIKPAANRPVVKEYIYKIPGLMDQSLKPNQVIDFPLFDPLDRFKTHPPVAVAGRVGDVDNAATDYIKMIYEHGGMPPVYLKTTQAMNENAITDARRRWRERYGNWKNWLEPAILDRDQTVEKLAWSFKEMGFDFLDARNEVRICMVLDVPPILIGAKAGIDTATYSNYELADRAWWRNDLLPMFNNLIDVVEFRLLPLFDQSGELYCRWDVSQVMALQENVNEIWSRATSAWTAGAITRNDFLAEIGKDGIGPVGEVYYMPITVEFVPAKQSLLPRNSVPAAEADSDPGDGKRVKALDVADNAPDDDERRRHERIVKRATNEYFAAQKERIIDDARNGR